MNNKPIVFVITPFGEDYLALYDDLKKTYEDKYEFTNGGDLDNQQNILQDIVEGIFNADVVIADLTGLNPNVFYELGLAHAMNKKVIIITQDINELPFDIKSYRANEYSLQFNKLPKFKIELTKLLNGAMDNSVSYGNPVMDYTPILKQTAFQRIPSKDKIDNDDVSNIAEGNDEEEKGFIDYIADIVENSDEMNLEFGSLNKELCEMNESIIESSKEINRVKEQSGTVDIIFTKKVCRKLSGPVNIFAEKLDQHVERISTCWSKVENSYLSLLDNPFIQTEENKAELDKSLIALDGLQSTIDESDEKVEGFADVLRQSLGIERQLNKAISSLIKQLERYLSMTDTMKSSVDRIKSKSEIIIKGNV